MLELAPLGSLIRVKNTKKKYIIVGKLITIDKTTYDYACVEYPFGFAENVEFTYFNNDDVIAIGFMGDINY